MRIEIAVTGNDPANIEAQRHGPARAIKLRGAALGQPVKLQLAYAKLGCDQRMFSAEIAEFAVQYRHQHRLLQPRAFAQQRRIGVAQSQAKPLEAVASQIDLARAIGDQPLPGKTEPAFDHAACHRALRID